MTLAVPYIVPPHRHHNATPVHFFCAAGSVQFLVVFAVGRGSAVLGLQRQQPSEQDGLSASLHSFQSHQTLDVLCANEYANDFAGGHWTTLRLFFLSMAELGTVWIVAVKVHFSFFFIYIYLCPS